MTGRTRRSGRHTAVAGMASAPPAVPEVRVGVAALAVAAGEKMLTTLGLGSCVAIILYDPVAHVGGLAHVLLPHESMSRDQSNPAKFPATAVPLMLEQMTRLGAQRARLSARLVGGASMFAGLLPAGGINVGDRNIEAARLALDLARLPVIAEDVGGDHGRSVYFDLRDGSVEVRSLRRGNRGL